MSHGWRYQMKKLTFGLLFLGGILMAQEAPVVQEVPVAQEPAHLSEDQRIALRTQSPTVKTHSWKHRDKPAKYVVTENKTTIVATRVYNGQ
jgi:hypothetical protein